jgi:hypothetical protein
MRLSYYNLYHELMIRHTAYHNTLGLNKTIIVTFEESKMAHRIGVEIQG